MPFAIVHSDEHNPILQITLGDGTDVRFSVKSVSEDRREWLGEILEETFNRVIKNAESRERKRIQEGIKALLGIG